MNYYPNKIEVEVSTSLPENVFVVKNVLARRTDFATRCTNIERDMFIGPSGKSLPKSAQMFTTKDRGKEIQFFTVIISTHFLSHSEWVSSKHEKSFK